MPTLNSEILMKTTTKFFQSLFLASFGVMGMVIMAFYLLAEVNEPEYLLYFAPIIGLLFYGSWYVIQHKLGNTFSQSFPDGE